MSTNRYKVSVKCLPHSSYPWGGTHRSLVLLPKQNSIKYLKFLAKDHFKTCKSKEIKNISETQIEL